MPLQNVLRANSAGNVRSLAYARMAQAVILPMANASVRPVSTAITYFLFVALK